MAFFAAQFYNVANQVDAGWGFHLDPKGRPEMESPVRFCRWSTSAIVTERWETLCAAENADDGWWQRPHHRPHKFAWHFDVGGHWPGRPKWSSWRMQMQLNWRWQSNVGRPLCTHTHTLARVRTHTHTHTHTNTQTLFLVVELSLLHLWPRVEPRC